MARNGNFNGNINYWGAFVSSITSAEYGDHSIVVTMLSDASGYNAGIVNRVEAGTLYSVGHRYLCTFSIKCSEASNWFYEINSSPDASFSKHVNANEWTRVEIFYTPQWLQNLIIKPVWTIHTGTTYEIKDVCLFDMTAMFGYQRGADITLDEFKEWLSKNIGLAPYYNFTGLNNSINSKPTGIASIGYNLMDLDGTTGTARVPGKYDDGLYGSYYGIQGTYSSVAFVPAATGISEEVTPDSDGKFEITRPGEIVVSDAGSSTTVFMWYDGSYTEDSVEYEYTPTTGLDVTKIYGKANGSNTYTQVFPNGICGINNIQDILDLKNAEATVKVGHVANLKNYQQL